MIIVKGNGDYEAGQMPSEEQLTNMTNYNEELITSGVFLQGEGLHPSSKGARVSFDGDDLRVTDARSPRRRRSSPVSP
jgi:hypothetical protein